LLLQATTLALDRTSEARKSVTGFVGVPGVIYEKFPTYLGGGDLVDDIFPAPAGFIETEQQANKDENGEENGVNANSFELERRGECCSFRFPRYETLGDEEEDCEWRKEEEEEEELDKTATHE
jgi:hypothetical protein